MKMMAQRRALDKIFKRRDRYEIPQWQRGKVWTDDKKRELIDSILRGWRLPKFYFVKVSEDQYEVVDGQQRLAAIFDFFSNELSLGDEAAAEFGGAHYKNLKSRFSDAFDDFEIDYDEIEDADEVELKLFFQRLQQGLPLTSSEKLNSVHSKLRDFCRHLSAHQFFKESIGVADTRLAHFDILTKAAAIEIEGIEAGLRFEDVRALFEAQSNFSASSAIAKRLRSALDFLAAVFPQREPALKNRTIVQSVITFTCKLVQTGKAAGLEKKLNAFVRQFAADLRAQVELGQEATDYDFIRFQKSINANVKAGPRIRQEILIRKAFIFDSGIAAAFDPSMLAESGIAGHVKELAEAIGKQISQLNEGYSAVHGEDLFKATNKTTQALLRIGKPLKDMKGYREFVDDLYFIFKEGVGQRLGANTPQSFKDVNLLRTDLHHDVDHGKKKEVASKKKKIGTTFKKYSGQNAPAVTDPASFVLVQANLLSALELELRNLITP